MRPLELNGDIAGYSVMNIELKFFQFVARKLEGKMFKWVQDNGLIKEFNFLGGLKGF